MTMTFDTDTDWDSMIDQWEESSDATSGLTHEAGDSALSSMLAPPPEPDEDLQAKLALINASLPLQTSMSLTRDGMLVFHNVPVPADLELPAGYGYKGGVARELLRRALGLPDTLADVRDLDLVEVTPHPEDLTTELSMRLMPEDFQHGYGVEPIGNITTYLGERDLTINEVLWHDNTLHASADCVLDTLYGVLRPTHFELSRYGQLNDKLVAKILRLSAEAQMVGESPAIEGIPEGIQISEFHIALHLDRALGKGEKLAELYIQNLVAHGHLETWVLGDACVDLAVEYLSEHLWDGVNFFRNYTPPADPVDENELSAVSENSDDAPSDDYDPYERFPSHEGFGRRSRIR